MRHDKGTDDLMCVASVEQEEPHFNYLNDFFFFQENTARRHFSVIYPLISSAGLFTVLSCLMTSLH